jgi:hypothetical protein
VPQARGGRTTARSRKAEGAQALSRTPNLPALPPIPNQSR